MSFGFTPSPLAHFCDWDNDEAAERPTKQALLVFPSHGAEKKEDEAMHEHLIAMRMRTPIINVMTATLRERGFNVETLPTYITADTLKQTIASTVRSQPDVLLVVYCGHGAGSALGASSLFLSGGGRITVHELHVLLAEYRGIIQFFDMCQ
jgi:rhodanese-related sulfurtransferase